MVTFFERMQKVWHAPGRISCNRLDGGKPQGPITLGMAWRPRTAEGGDAPMRILIMNFHQARVDPRVLLLARPRTAFVDIDPGLTRLDRPHTAGAEVSAHDVYFTDRRTVGTPSSGMFPEMVSVGRHIHPQICYAQLWRHTYTSRHAARSFTTVPGGASRNGSTVIEEADKRSM